MSQFFIQASGSTPPPPGELTIVTDDGTAMSVGGIINFNAEYSSEDNVNRIVTRVDPNLSNNVLAVLTNMLRGTGTTVNNGTADLVTFPLGATPSVFRFWFHIVGLANNGDGVGYLLEGSVKTDGATATIIQTQFLDDDEDNSLEPECEMNIVVSGNNVIVRATGQTGFTISYTCLGQYLKGT